MPIIENIIDIGEFLSTPSIYPIHFAVVMNKVNNEGTQIQANIILTTLFRYYPDDEPILITTCITKTFSYFKDTKDDERNKEIKSWLDAKISEIKNKFTKVKVTPGKFMVV